MIEIIPGDPASFMLGINAEPDTINALKKELGLDVSVLERYYNWIQVCLLEILGFHILTGFLYQN